ncbi:heavy metal-associated isoprenylated plant protein 7-like isoform X2 [Triticum aestivum]|uniref:heavy metal-associated isoprenylated plant protein 7-like isoform X2 n=1 Tax=Triticum aestivum TaxID=4565 RepID=UPI001D00A533|nr:heavy metal-associated isoprenylated plant protein 7-like isoform X2 [Triticum aestivum]XP_044447388.1 heavy metal-associated isoprenylated plant protein 7-like isoform X2 [Triticum aestivum]
MGEEQKESEKEESAEEPRDISLKVDMDCQGCAKKVEKSLLIFEGVENVRANSQPKTVVVKSRTADPTKVCERVQRKTKRRVELISPIHPPPP